MSFGGKSNKNINSVVKNTIEIKKALELTSIEEVWGIGRRLSLFLKKYNIHNAYQF